VEASYVKFEAFLTLLCLLAAHTGGVSLQRFQQYLKFLSSFIYQQIFEDFHYEAA
jgi:hypothetical protein